MADLQIIDGEIGYLDSAGNVVYTLPVDGIASKAQLDTVSTENIFFKNPKSVTKSTTLPDDEYNYMVIGPISVDSDVILTVEGSLVVI